MDYGTPGNKQEDTILKNFSHYRATRMGTMFFFASLISLFFQTIIFPFFFASLSIFFAYLAKGKRAKNDWYNRLTILLSSLILIINLVFCGYIVYSISHDTMMHRQFDTVSEQLYGMSFNEYMQQLQNSVSNAGGTLQ